MIKLLSCPVDDDSFLILPALVVTQGRDHFGNLRSGWLISAQWMMWGFGIALEF